MIQVRYTYYSKSSSTIPIGNFLQFYHAWLCLIFSFLDDENKKPKIKVEIKPISAIQKADVSTGSSSSFSASVDELRSAVVGLEIAPSIGVSEMLSNLGSAVLLD